MTRAGARGSWNEDPQTLRIESTTEGKERRRRVRARGRECPRRVRDAYAREAWRAGSVGATRRVLGCAGG